MLRGRERECGLIRALLRQAGDGQGGGIVLSGDPGIGKTALLEYVRECATEMHVLCSTGLESESELGYATLRRLLGSVLDGIDALPKPQAVALGGALGQRMEAPANRFLVSLAALSLLSEQASRKPVLCVIDDAHWADGPSLDTFGFMARRLSAEPIALVLATRLGTERTVSGSGLTELTLSGLDDVSARALLHEHGGRRLSLAEQDRVLLACAGNPLAIREFAASPTHVRYGEPLPLADGLRRAFLERAHRCGDQAQALLLLIAADDSGRADVLRKAAACLGVDTTPLGTADLDGLIYHEGSTIGFRHPLIRAAVYHGTTQARRRAAHQALAVALASGTGELDRRAWHLSQAAAGTDERIANELDQSARRMRWRAGPAAAAAVFTRAAELSVSEADATGRRIEAAKSWLDSGDIGRTTLLLDDLDRDSHASTIHSLDIAELRATIEIRAGSPHRALKAINPLMPGMQGKDRRRALRFLMLQTEASFLAGINDAWTEEVSELAASPTSRDDTEALLLRVLRASLRARAGVEPHLRAEQLQGLESLTDPIALAHVSEMAWDLGRFELARSMRARATRQARMQGAAGSLAWVLLFESRFEMVAGRYGAAEAYAEEGYKLAQETAQANTACRHQSLLAMIAAIQGRSDTASSLARELLSQSAARGLPPVAASCYHALGMLDLIAGRYENALTNFEMMGRLGATPSGVVLAVPDLVEAAVRVGKPDRAKASFAQYQAWAASTDAPELKALAARCHALVASGDAAKAAYQQALEYHARVARPFDQARTQLLFGEYLCRERRRSAARPYLRAALDAFARLNTPSWAARARAELRSAGQRVTPSDPRTLTALTAQELRIALAVAEGATNREIASDSFVSPRTIEYHLRKIFNKTGTTSRTELVRLVRASAT